MVASLKVAQMSQSRSSNAALPAPTMAPAPAIMAPAPAIMEPFNVITAGPVTPGPLIEELPDLSNFTLGDDSMDAEL